MSFTIAHELFMRVRVADHGTGEELDDFLFRPTPRCRKLLADHQLLFKQRETGFDLYLKKNPNASPQLLGAIASRREFSFGISLQNPAFFDTYQPGANAIGKRKMYLTNLTPSGNIQAPGNQRLMEGASVQLADLFQLKPKTYNETTDLGGAPAPAEWVVKEHFSGTAIGDPFPVSSQSGVDMAFAKIDLSEEANGLYDLEPNPSTIAGSAVYVDDYLGGRGVIGLVNLYWESAQTSVPAGGQAYFIRFAKI
ncbi:MAG TPA: hypothetical protein ENJ95_11880 [Bacteroidetes bacterium]|nr:hypothetical protein [Bacteroidota bacterium]